MTSTVIASVGNEILTLDDALEQIPPFILEADTLNALVSFKNIWINSQIALRHAERIRLPNSAEVQKRMERLRVQVLEEALKEAVLNEHKEELQVTTEEAQNYYQQHRERFMLDERYVRFRHLTTRTRTEADNANRDLMRNVPWEEIVNEYSVDPEQQLRESNQFWPVSVASSKSSLPPELRQYLNVMGITERSPIQFFQGHYHFIQLTDERPEGDNPDLEWLIPQIKEWLKLEKARRITDGYMRNLYLEAEANNEIRSTNVTEIESILSNLD